MSLSENEDDVAQPIYRTRSKNFMHFGNVQSEDDLSMLRDDTSVIKRLEDDGTDRPQLVAVDDQASATDNELLQEADITMSLRDVSEYERFRQLSLEAPVTPEDSPIEQPPADSKGLEQQVQSMFDLDENDNLIQHFPAWLLKSVLLQGHLFFTQRALCFYSYIPAREDITLKSGYLSKKSKTLSRHVRRWFILKNNMLSYYENASDLYFPHGNIDLRQALSATADLDHLSEPGYGFKILTSRQEYYFRADTASAVMEWVRVLQKVIFRLNNDGDCVKILIPLPSILDVETSKVLQFADTMKVKIADDNETYAINEYYFTLFDACQTAIEMIKDQTGLVADPQSGSNGKPLALSDTSKDAPQYHRSEVVNAIAAFRSEHPQVLPNIEIISHGMVEQHSRNTGLHIPGLQQLGQTGRSRSRSRSRSRPDPLEARADTLITTATMIGQGTQGLTTNVTKLLGTSLKTVSKLATSAYRVPMSALQQPFQGLLSSDDTVVDSAAEDEAISHSFALQFGSSPDERLLKSYKAFYGRRLPLAGELYVSDERICFRSTAPARKTRIVLPLEEVERSSEAPGFTFGFAGLVLSIRAHEDMYFEFMQSSERNQSLQFINGAIDNLKAIEDYKRSKRRTVEADAEIARSEHMAVQRALKTSGMLKDVPIPSIENAIDVPPIIFDSPSASMVAFKPQKRLRFTCLTIGSRGDVQPYVALCKGLIADGQYARIATHEEFREFVTGHGIDFVPIDGNPAELMAICVEHGMFTYSFLKEASRKFRGWIDGLLKSSWSACQETDVLIESPSAMGGIHIAEALGIPYFRAFTMPWSKTKIYPHAFAVPDHNMGGNYNALTYTAFDNLFWKAISGQINRWRKKTLNLPATTYERLAQHKVPFLYNFSPSVVPPARDWHEWIRVTGYWFLDNSHDKDNEKWTPPDAVVDFIRQARESERKLVYIGFGSIVVADPKALTRAVIDAVNKADVKCILVKGWSARSAQHAREGDDEDEPVVGVESSIPQQTVVVKEIEHSSEQEDFGPNILSLDSIPHDWLFPQLDAACHHGGAGSLGASLRAGIPTIVKPFFGDQHFFGGRVHDLGVGVCLHSLTVNTLAQALEKCTTNKEIMQKAQRIGEQIRSERGVDNAIESIYRDLEYARSLIKSPHRTAAEGSQSSGESYEVIEAAGDDEDDADLFETKIDEHGARFSILRPFKSLKLPNPLGDRYGSYGLSGMKLLPTRIGKSKGKQA